MKNKNNMRINSFMNNIFRNPKIEFLMFLLNSINI